MNNTSSKWRNGLSFFFFFFNKETKKNTIRSKQARTNEQTNKQTNNKTTTYFTHNYLHQTGNEISTLTSTLWRFPNLFILSNTRISGFCKWWLRAPFMTTATVWRHFFFQWRSTDVKECCGIETPSWRRWRSSQKNWALPASELGLWWPWSESKRINKHPFYKSKRMWFRHFLFSASMFSARVWPKFMSMTIFLFFFFFFFCYVGYEHLSKL